MKVVSRKFVFSLDLKDINKAVADLLKSSGYELTNQISLPDLRDFSNSGKLTVNAGKFDEAKISAFDGIKHNLPKLLIDRVKRRLSGLSMLIENVHEDQINKFILDAFSGLPADRVALLTFAYKTEYNGGVAKVKDVAKEFGLDNALKSWDTAIANFADRLKFTLLNELRAGNLIANKTIDDVMDINVSDLGFSVRTLNCLIRADVDTLRSLLEKNIDEVKKSRNFGEQGVIEIENFKKLYKI
ncbi:MAG: DNA-directed RNA polymerase subunit alpha C-terminal domain-containing protein [Candidatus Falkowbacteria bacterium]